MFTGCLLNAIVLLAQILHMQQQQNSMILWHEGIQRERK